MKGPTVYSVFTTKDGRRITLRPLKSGDLGALVTFANKFAKERKTNRELGIISMDKRMTRARERRFLRRQLDGQRKGRLISVAAFNGTVLVGHCDIEGRSASDEKHTGVLGIAIVAGYRAVGLGEALIKSAFGQASAAGIWVIELTVFATNGPAKHLYEKLGFREVGVVPMKMRRDGRYIDEVRMYTHLPHK